MLTLESLRRKDIRDYFSSTSLSRAKTYRHRVSNPVRRDNMLLADVQGAQTYRVEITVDARKITATCTCPYDWSGYCKHIGAVLLVWIETPQLFKLKPLRNKTTPATVLETIPVELPPPHYSSVPPAWIVPSPDDAAAEREALQAALSVLRVQDLRRIARNGGWKVKGMRKADIVTQVAEKIVEPAVIAHTYRSASPQTQTVLRAVALTQDDPDSDQYASRFFQVVSVWIKNQDDVYQAVRNCIDNTGLCLSFGNDYGYYSLRLRIPSIILRHLPPLLTELTPPVKERHQAGQTRLAGPYDGVNTTIQMMLYFRQFSTPLRPPLPRPKLENTFYWLKEWDYLPEEILRWNAGLEQAKLTVPTQQYALPDDVVARLSPLAGGAERLDFLYHILHAGGLLQSGSPVKIREELYLRFLQMSVDDQRALLVRFYMSTRGWNELWVLLRHDEKMQLKRKFNESHIEYHEFISKLLKFRQWILQALAYLPDGEWLSMADIDRIFQKIWADVHMYDIPRYRHTVTHAWEIQYEGKPLKTIKHSQDWDKLQGAFLRRVFTALHWLGIADLRGSDRAPIQYVRLLGFRDIFLKNPTPVAPDRATPTPQPQNSVRVDGSRITVNIAADAAVLLTISRLAVMESVSATDVTYYLDIATAHRSFESGKSAADLLASWRQNISPDVPPAIQTQLEEWWQAYGQVQLYRDMTLIEFADDHMLAEMKAVTALNDWLVAEISPRAILISAAGVDALVAELEKAGYTPKITEQIAS